MIIELERAHTPEDMGNEENCAVCKERFVSEVVLAMTRTDQRDDMGLMCPICIGVLGRYRPDKFPTLADYKAFLDRFNAAGGPIWSSIEEATAAWEEGESYHATLEANRQVA